MNFVTVPFLILVLVSWLAFISSPAIFRFPILLVASYVFYCSWSLPFIAVLVVSTSVDYWMSLVIHRTTRKRIRKFALISGVTINLLILGFFKYINFFFASLTQAETWLGFKAEAPYYLELIVPLGISFYTFEAISYLVDVYKGMPPAKSWIQYNFFIMFFPHLICGPIVRYQQLSPQYENPIQLPPLSRLSEAFSLILAGACMKVFLADPLSTVVDPLYVHPETADATLASLGIVAFAIQIYYDFLGYTQIARGTALLFNIQLPVNFDHPYQAGSISEYWQHWNMSLTRWIRDYVYIPLGGTQTSLLHTARALMLTMLFAGAWHGAGWTYIVFGAYHGVLLAAYHGIRRLRSRLFEQTTIDRILAHPAYHGVSVVATFLMVALGLVLFRARNLETAGAVFNAITKFDLSHRTPITTVVWVALLLLSCFYGSKLARLLSSSFQPLHYTIKSAIISLAFTAIYVYTGQKVQPFIYFQF